MTSPTGQFPYWHPPETRVPGMVTVLDPPPPRITHAELDARERQRKELERSTSSRSLTPFTDFGPFDADIVHLEFEETPPPRPFMTHEDPHSLALDRETAQLICPRPSMPRSAIKAHRQFCSRKNNQPSPPSLGNLDPTQEMNKVD